MATIKYSLQSNGENAQIYIRLSVKRGLYVKRKTGFVIDTNNWSEKTNFPKQSTAELKQLRNDLNKLETYIYENLNTSLATGGIIDGTWLETQINQCFGRIEETDNTLLVNHTQYIIDNANTRKVQGRKQLGISESRKKGYVTFMNIIIKYQKKLKKEIRFTDINKQFVNAFTNWLINTEKYSVNYAGKQIDNLKTVCLDAQKNDIPTNDYVIHIEGFSESKEDRNIVTLSFEELEQIRNTELKNVAHQNVRNWIMLGCEIGQRGNDLMNITPDNIRFKNGGYYIDLIQQKTKKNITVSIIDDYVIDIIENNFPYKISIQKLNDHIKEICKIAGIDTPTEGKKMNPITKRKETGIYPKYELVSSHCFRRSFATNYYRKIPTAVLIGITGHSKESLFREYINQKEDKDANADLFRYFHEIMNKDKQPTLKVLKTASNQQ